jgi:hypothetical protein
MGTMELKSNIHKIVDSIQNEQLLKSIYDFLKLREKDTTGRLWKLLTDEQKEKVLIAYEESEDELNLIEREKIFKRE